VQSFFTFHKRNLRLLTLILMLFSYFKCWVVFGKVMGNFSPLRLKIFQFYEKSKSFGNSHNPTLQLRAQHLSKSDRRAQIYA